MTVRVTSQEDLFDVGFTTTNLRDKNTTELRRALVELAAMQAMIREVLRQRGADGQ